MTELANFPHISQRDSDANADFDCVPASLAMCLQWLTGRKYTAQQIKDAVYGASYTGGTAASAYVAYCAAQGVKLAPVNGNGMQLVAALKAAIGAQHPAILTEPDPYMPAADGYSHVCAAYKFDAGSITVVDPWIDQDVTKSDAEWASQLEFNQIWTLEKPMQTYSEHSADFGQWFTATDSSHWKSKAGPSVQFGIKGFYAKLSIDGQHLPVIGLPRTDEQYLTINGKQIVLQVFERGAIWYDANHVKGAQPGTDGICQLAFLTDPDLLARIPGLNLPTAPGTPVDTTALVAAINAIPDAIAPAVAAALVEAKKL